MSRQGSDEERWEQVSEFLFTDLPEIKVKIGHEDLPMPVISCMIEELN